MSMKDYLKKYLPDSSEKKKKKKKVNVDSTGRHKSKIVDDDIDLKNMRPVRDGELEIFDVAEEAPQVVGIIDESRTSSRWKLVADEYGFEDVKVTAVDLSPPRRHQRESPVQRQMQKSPPRKSTKDGRGSDAESIRRDRQRKEEDSDASPPQKTKNRVNLDASPRRKKTNHDDSDASPPRKTKNRENSDASPRRRKTNHDDSDASPPRKTKNRDNLDASPQRRKTNHYDSDASPPRKQRKHSDSDASPPRKKRDHADSYSSPRRARNDEPNISRIKKKMKVEDEKLPRDDKVKRTLEGKKAGLQDASDLRKETAEQRQKQKESFAQMSDELSGRNATVVMRDRKTGRRRDPKEEARLKREKDQKEAEKIAKYAVWGKGVKQVSEREKKLQDDLYEMSKPLARYADDKDLEEMLKNEERDGDPMLAYIRAKKRKAAGGSDVTKEKVYQGSFMPNRYGIRPGSQWDGVDRSNGFEKRWFEELNTRRATEEEAFKWSTSDM